MPSKNHVIIIPGLGNNISRHIWATNYWKKWGVVPHVFDTRWRTEERGYMEKQERAVKLVDSLSNRTDTISLVGNSAGSSLALNIFGKRKKQIAKVVINCGRIRDGDWPWFSFAQAAASSPSFRESVLQAQELETTLTPDDRIKIMTLRPLFDEIVPPFTVPIQGARNDVVYSVEHSVTIALNLTLFRGRILDFIMK